MTEKISVSVDNVKIRDIHGVHVVTFNTKINGHKGHGGFAETSRKFKQSMYAKIVAYCKKREK